MTLNAKHTVLRRTEFFFYRYRSAALKALGLEMFMRRRTSSMEPLAKKKTNSSDGRTSFSVQGSSSKLLLLRYIGFNFGACEKDPNFENAFR